MKKLLIPFFLIGYLYSFSQSSCFYGLSPANVYTTSTNPKAVQSGDFNGDGNNDLVIANSTNIQLFLGSSSGGFSGSSTFSISGGPLYLAVADFNSDGKNDVAAANNANYISILLGTGTGSFSAPSNYTVAPSGNCTCLSAADFNSDGKPDLAVGTNNGAVFMANNGSGAFTFSSNISGGTGTMGMDADDFDNDGKKDLTVSYSFPNGVTLYKGSGTGSFTQTGMASSLNAKGVSFGDFNGDGIKDIVTANFNTYSVSVFFTAPSGSLSAGPTYTVGLYPYWPETNDFNGDGTLDIAVQKGYGLSILYNNGSGTFTSTVHYPAGNSMGQPVLADLNSDGLKDMASVSYWNNRAYVYFNDNNTGLKASKNYLPDPFIWYMNSDDLNNDGFSDIIGVTPYDRALVMLGNGSGAFSTASSYTTGSNPFAIATGYFNADSNKDFVVTNNAAGSISVYLGTGSGNFATAVTYTSGGTSPRDIVSGDYNNDGNTDLVVANWGAPNVHLLQGNGAGIFSSVASFTTGNTPRSLAKADFNNDGKSDIAVANQGSNSVSLMLATGTGSFIISSYTLAAGSGAVQVISKDFNNDGNADAAIMGNSKITIMAGTGTGSLTSLSSFTTPIQINKMQSQDINGDGEADLVAAGYTGAIFMYHGDGSGNFMLSSSYIAEDQTLDVNISDYNNDGSFDVGSSSGFYESVNILLHSASPSVAISGPSTTCYGTPVTLTANGASSYSWTTGSTSSGISVTPTITTSYSVVGSNSLGCTSNTAIKTISVNPSPTVSISSTHSILCTGQSATLTAFGANSYSWNPGGSGNNIVISPSSNTSYSVTGADLNGCKNGTGFTQSVSTCADISELQHPNSDFLIIPNPNNGEFTLRHANNYPDHENNGQVEIFNAKGESVMTTPLVEREMKIDLRGLANGIYMVRITAQSGVVSKKVVKE